MNAWRSLIYLIAVTAFPWLLWAGLRVLWMRRRERKVLANKYGDLEMFSDRLQEWGVIRNKPSDGGY